MSEDLPTGLGLYGWTFLRWKKGEPREGRPFGLMPEDHPLAQYLCPLCASPLGGHETQLLAIGPNDQEDQEDQEKHDSGRWYSAAALVFHADCLRVR